MLDDKMPANPSECEHLDDYESAIEEVAGNDNRTKRVKCSILNDVLFVYKQRGCKASCDVRDKCEKMLAGKLTPEMIARVPAARFLPNIYN
jgi:hypothetical protein